MREARCHTLARARLDGCAAARAAAARSRRFSSTVRGVGVTLGGRRVLDDIDLSLPGGQVVAVVGANGAGKTTLLRALAGLQAHSGALAADAGGAPRLGLCFQNADQQIFNASVRQEILFGNAAIDERLYRCVVELLGLGAATSRRRRCC